MVQTSMLSAHCIYSIPNILVYLYPNVLLHLLWISALFHPTWYLYVYCISVNKFLKNMVQFCLCHDIDKVDITINLSDVHDLPSFIKLLVVYYINYWAFFLGCAKFNKTIVQSFQIRAKNHQYRLFPNTFHSWF